MTKLNRVYAMQLVRSFQVGELSRRQFVQRATAALGSAAAANLLLAACQPVAPGATVPPPVVAEGDSDSDAMEPTEGMVMEMIEYDDLDGSETLMGYLAYPDDGEAHSAVVVLQEWWGLDAHIKDIANRFAEEGFVALAPDLYHGQVTTEPDEARKLVMELDMEEAVREIQAAIDYLQAQDFVAGPQVGVTGFCMGGGLALMTALAEEDLGAAVAWYGRPLSPEQAAEAQAPILGLYGAEDGGIPVEAVEAMEAALTDAGVENEFHIYEGAPHAFFNDTRDSYTPDAADDAWPRTLEWFREHL